jgi:hypothetical protein
MTQILDAPPQLQSEQILCSYKNCTDKMEIIRIANIERWYFERVVFPQQQLMFYAFPEAMLEVHTSHDPSLMLDSRISCDRLRVNEMG